MCAIGRRQCESLQSFLVDLVEAFLSTPSSSITNLRSISIKMSSRSISKAVRSPLARQLVKPAVQRRTFVSALNAVRATAVARPVAVAGPAQQQVRGVKTIDFAGHPEEVFGELTSRFLSLLDVEFHC